MARVILVRHCESESNQLGDLDGGSNSPLSPRGREEGQARVAVPGSHLAMSALGRKRSLARLRKLDIGGPDSQSDHPSVS
jgi:broad specificity phosphatase PhoE